MVRLKIIVRLHSRILEPPMDMTRQVSLKSHVGLPHLASKTGTKSRTDFIQYQGFNVWLSIIICLNRSQRTQKFSRKFGHYRTFRWAKGCSSKMKFEFKKVPRPHHHCTFFVHRKLHGQLVTRIKSATSLQCRFHMFHLPCTSHLLVYNNSMDVKL